MILLPGKFKTFSNFVRSYTLCSKLFAITIASVGHATIQRLHIVQVSRWYTKVSMAFFFFPSSLISNFVRIFMEPFGQANSHAVHPVHLCSFCSSCSITTSPRKRSASFNVLRLSGYECVSESPRRSKYFHVNRKPVPSDFIPL